MTSSCCGVLASDRFLPGVNNEESCGEGLSLFLTQQFAVFRGFASPCTSFTANTANGWLNSSLPTSKSNSTRFYDKTSTSQGYDYGSRVDYVNSIVPWFGNGPGTGCSILFIYYLYQQLGSKIPQIIAGAAGYDSNNKLKATAPLRGVYQNLTGDNSDPFPFFKQLLDAAHAPDQVSSIPGPNPDNPFPLLGDGRFGAAGISVVHPRSDEGAVSLYVLGFDGKVWSNFWPKAPGSLDWAGWFSAGDNTFPIYVVGSDVGGAVGGEVGTHP
jgi:hypothetical protein